MEWEYGGNDVRGSWCNEYGSWEKVQKDPLKVTNIDFPAYLAVDDGYLDFNLEVWKVKRWKCHQWPADHYDQHGFVSSGHTLYAHKDNKMEFESFYTYRGTNISNGGNPPPGGGGN